MKKKVLSAMLVATMTATMFAGCGSDKGTTNDTQGGSASNDKVETQDVKLTVMGPSEDQDDAQGAWLKTECEAFNEEHPEWNITFDYVTCSESEAKDTVLQDPAFESCHRENSAHGKAQSVTHAHRPCSPHRR